MVDENGTVPFSGASEGKSLPVICFQYVGAGKVLFHAVNETWRWRYRVGDEYFARYWIQTIRYLCRSKLSDAGRMVTLVADRANMPRASRCICGCDSPTSVLPRPRTTA